MQQPAIGHDGAKRPVTLREIRSMFCCPYATDSGYFQNYFPKLGAANLQRPNEQLPQYVTKLLFSERGKAVSDQPKVPNNDGWSAFRAVGVYDMRDEPNLLGTQIVFDHR
jgi:hypothetical protein